MQVTHLLLHHLQALFGSTLCYCKNFYILHLNFSFSSCLFLSLLIVWSCSLSFYFCHFCSACGFIELLMNNFPPCSRHSFKASIPNLRLIISVSSQVLIKVQTKFFLICRFLANLLNIKSYIMGLKPSLTTLKNQIVIP